MISPDLIFFFDIETTPEHERFMDLPEAGKYAFNKKFDRQVANGTYTDLEDAYRQQAPLLAEFSKVVAISGLITRLVEGATSVRIDTADLQTHRQVVRDLSLCDDDEEVLLSKFRNFLRENIMPNNSLCVGGHNIKMFDVPFLNRRYIINGLAIPSVFDTYGKKPWELTRIIDTAEIWKFTDGKYMISLASLCYALGLASPKVTMDGSQVQQAIAEGRRGEVAAYALEDAKSAHNCYCRISGHHILH